MMMIILMFTLLAHFPELQPAVTKNGTYQVPGTPHNQMDKIHFSVSNTSGEQPPRWCAHFKTTP